MQSQTVASRRAKTRSRGGTVDIEAHSKTTLAPIPRECTSSEDEGQKQHISAIFGSSPAHSGLAAPDIARRKRVDGIVKLLAYLGTGTTLTLLSQAIVNQDLADHTVQVLALVKFSAIFCFATARQTLSPSPAPTFSSRTTSLVTLLGILDVLGYAAFTKSKLPAPMDPQPHWAEPCTATLDALAKVAGPSSEAVLHPVAWPLAAKGLTMCGAALCTLVSAAAQQLFTALLARLVLGRRLTPAQHASLLLVVVGLGIRALGDAGSSGLGPGHDSLVLQGVVLTALSSLIYAVLNVLYDYTVETTPDPPAHTDMMGHMAKVGLIANVAYTAAFTVPGWDSLVTQHLMSHERAPGGMYLALTSLVGFGALYNLHGVCQGRAFRAEGALGVALVNSMKGSTVAVVSSLLFCRGQAPGQCLSASSSLSALAITAGGIAWVLSPGVPAKGKLTRKLTKQLSRLDSRVRQ